MKITLLVALGAAFFIIGVHQSFYYGIPSSYWLFMLSGACFLGIQYVKKMEEQKKDAAASSKSTTKKKK
ncbi:hypothetical protein [Flammeovirga kamogawensis]|uniref:DUF3188 domain-containing protein n=1 Tax=Flammeovirga kamogawensis TaxID=373891 RepID=A0ABX8H042_9BACT|nr:hypothetical protein [Flammeovirga kamogawensis]MBB6459401.1 putative membrane protein [Flammeovirga kamogawensis]QWG08957.1 hypothetical protein KM029_08430 [Flammeovirga kamogawensis]TRX67247.1 hypothetical protein EO216_03475 [Flammeovirga kamogawensis]